MSEQLELKAHLTAQDDASPVIRKLRREVDALNASIKRSFGQAPTANFMAGIKETAKQYGKLADQARQHTQETKATTAARRALTVETAKSERVAADARRAETRHRSSMLGFDQRQLAFGLRMSRQRDQETRQREREEDRRNRRQIAFGLAMDRQRAQEGRQQDRERQRDATRLSRDRDALRRSMGGRGRDAYQRGSSGLERSTRSAGLVGALGFGAAAAAARKSLMAESDVDAAEINARAYAGLSKEAARALRKDWAGALSESLGTSSAELIRSYVDAAKLGIPDAGARDFASLSTKVSEAWDVQLSEVVDVLGTVNTILTSGGKSFDIGRVHSVSNTMQHLAASMSTTPMKMISFLKRGAGASQLLGMSQEAGLAFGAASTSLGNEAFSSGRAFDFIAGRIAELPRIMRRNGDDATEARKLVNQLGYGGLQGLQRDQRANPDEFIFDFLDRFNRIADPQRRSQALRFFAGQEWLGELGRMVTGMSTVREAQKLAKEAKGIDTIEQVWSLHQQKLSFAFKQVRAGFLNVLGEVGMALSPAGGQVRDYFLGWSTVIRQGGLKSRIDAAIAGLAQGFGFKSIPDLLTGWFGKPGQGEAGAMEAWGRAARGFAAGLRDVGTTIRTFLSSLGGGDPETMARWTARILGFGMAARIASPAVDFLGGLAGAIIGLGHALAMGFVAQRLMAISALLSGGAAAAGAGAAGAGLALTLPAALLIGGAVAVAVTNWPELKKWFASGFKPSAPEYDADQAEMQRRLDSSRGRAWGYLRILFGVGGAKASELAPGADAAKGITRSVDKLTETFTQTGARVHLASIASGGALTASMTGGGVGGGSSVTAGGSGGSIGNGAVNSFGLTRRGIIGGGGSSGTPGSGLFDAIIQAEGTAKGGRDPYNTVLGYGRYGSPSKNLTDMTLNEVRDFGLTMRRAQAAKGTPWDRTSSASGAFQITGSTMMDVARALGMDPSSTRFTPEVQRAMASWIAQKRGLSPWEGFKHHPGELAKARAAVAGGTGAAPSLQSLSAGMIPVKASGGQTVMMDPRAGIGQAFAGGQTHAGVLAAAQAFTQGNLPGGINRFTAFNDTYHQRRGGNSLHRLGLAGDFTIKDPSKSAEAAEAIRNHFRGAGLSDDMFRVIDEYRSRSGNWTSPHLHWQFNSAEAAAKYAESQRAKAIAAGQQQSASGIAGSIPAPTPPPARRGGMFDPNGGAGNPTFSAPITIHGGAQSSEEIATAVQRRIQEAMNWRTHDYESEMT